MTTQLDATPLSISEITQRIHLIRGQRVVLDTDLAAFYGETTKRFNQQVNRNLNRFPPGFMFQLDEQEFANLRLQSATSSLKGGHGGRRYAPLAFTEHGAIMASMVLNSPRATELSVYVVQAFVELRGMLASNRELAGKVHILERKVSVHDRNIAELVDSMAELLAAPPTTGKRAIGFLPLDDKKGSPKATTGRGKKAT
jgi:ORF6N domain